MACVEESNHHIRKTNRNDHIIIKAEAKSERGSFINQLRHRKPTRAQKNEVHTTVRPVSTGGVSASRPTVNRYSNLHPESRQPRQDGWTGERSGLPAACSPCLLVRCRQLHGTVL